MEGEGYPAVTWNQAFGVHSASGAVTYLGDKSKEQTYLLYPVGRHLGICTPMDNKATAGSMSFVPLEREITAIAVSNNAKHVAVVEGISRDAKHRGVPSSRISVFRLDAKEGGGVKGTPVKVLRLSEVPEVSFAEIASIAWTPDDKHLIVQSGMPNWALCFWKWMEQNDTAVAWEQLDEAVTRVSAHPAHNKLVITSGPNLLRQWEVTTDTKEPRFEKKEISLEGPRCRYSLGPSEEFTDHCWLVQKKKDKDGEEEALEPKLLVGTSEGTLLIFRQGKLDYIMADYWKDTAIPGEDTAAAQDSAGEVEAWADRSITCCHALATGFAVANAAGFVFVFEFAGAGLQFKREFQMKRSASTDDHESPFVLRNRLCVKAPLPLSSTPDPPSMSGANWGEEKATTVYVRTLTSNRDESSMAAVFSDGQVASFPLDDVDLMERDSNPFVPIAGGVHLPGHTINGVDTCRMQPLAVTCGTDRTIRVWDLEKKYCTVSKEFSEELLSASIHPSGLHVAAGFTDKIRLFNVMLKDLKCFGEINVKECHAIQFSHGGHLIAVAHSATIELYETYTFSRVGLLAGHIHTVSSLTWSHDDSGLVSAGMDGSVYEWEIHGEHAGQRKHTETADPVRKGVNYTHAIYHPTMHSKVLACGSDRQVRQLEQGMTRDGDELQITGGDIVQIALSSRGTMLFAAMSDGRVCVYSYPFSSRQPQEYHTHAGGITGMALSGDGKYLLTVGTDSTMYVMKIQTEPGPKKEGIPGKKMSNLLHDGFDIGMVVRTEMQALDDKIEELQKTMQSLKEEHAMKLEMTKSDALKSQRQTQLELENTRKGLEHDVHRLDHTLREEIDKSEQAKKNLEKTAMDSRIALEKMYQEKLADQAHQIQEVVNAREDAKQKFEETYLSLEDKQHQKILALRDEMDMMREEHQSVLTKAADDQLMMKMAFDEHLRQMEAEYEREVEELQEQQELERADLKAVVARTKNDFSMLEKKMLENNRAARGVGAELEMTALQMKELKQELEHERRANKALRRDMKEREEKLTEKEQRLSELKNDIRGLEKLKFLQDHQLMAMKEEIEPLNQELTRMREHQTIIDNELEEDLAEKQKLNYSVEQLKLKIGALEKEVKEQRMTIRKKERFVALFAQDLTRIIASMDPSEWQQPVQALYRKYVENEGAAKARGGASIDVDGVESALETQAREWGRQRDFSERRLAAWKHKSTLVDDKARYLNNRRVAENSALITECNELRMANKELKTRILKLASELKESQYETVAAKREAATVGAGRAGGGRVGSASGRPGTAGSDASYRQHGRPGTAGSVTSAASSRQTAVSNVFTYQSRASSAASNAGGMYAGQKRGGSAGSTRPFSAESAEPGTGGQEPLDTIRSQVAADLPGRPSSALGQVELPASSGASMMPGEAQRRPPPGSSGRLFKGKTGLRPKSASAVVPRQGDAVMLPPGMDDSRGMGGVGGTGRPRSADNPGGGAQRPIMGGR